MSARLQLFSPSDPPAAAALHVLLRDADRSDEATAGAARLLRIVLCSYCRIRCSSGPGLSISKALGALLVRKALMDHLALTAFSSSMKDMAPRIAMAMGTLLQVIFSHLPPSSLTHASSHSHCRPNPPFRA